MSDDELDWQKNTKPIIKSEKLTFKTYHKANIRSMINKVNLRRNCLNTESLSLSFCLDYNTKSKVDKGKYFISDELDLHGYSIENAYYKLIYFIIKNYQAGNRCLLIVTGNAKGETGTIKSNLSKWLSNTEIQHMVLYYQQAINKHGGNGAFYVLLRRNKKLKSLA